MTEVIVLLDLINAIIKKVEGMSRGSIVVAMDNNNVKKQSGNCIKAANHHNEDAATECAVIK